MTGVNIFPKAQPSGDSWAKVVLLVLTGAVAAFQVGKIPLTLKYLQSDLGFDLFMAGWVCLLSPSDSPDEEDSLCHRRHAIL